MSKVQYKGEATAEQISEWKKKHGSIFRIETEGHVCYLHKPTRKNISYASAAGKSDPLKFNELILRDCWVGGSEEIRTDDELFLAASGVLDQLIEIKQASLEKL
ncbi:MAG: hypothetical protein LUF04_07215 [Bacteroides sp.]|nr:hypothetical protein [Bacteroides sp.]